MSSAGEERVRGLGLLRRLELRHLVSHVLLGGGDAGESRANLIDRRVRRDDRAPRLRLGLGHVAVESRQTCPVLALRESPRTPTARGQEQDSEKEDCKELTHLEHHSRPSCPAGTDAGDTARAFPAEAGATTGAAARQARRRTRRRSWRGRLVRQALARRPDRSPSRARPAGRARHRDGPCRRGSGRPSRQVAQIPHG